MTRKFKNKSACRLVADAEIADNRANWHVLYVGLESRGHNVFGFEVVGDYSVEKLEHFAVFVARTQDDVAAATSNFEHATSHWHHEFSARLKSPALLFRHAFKAGRKHLVTNRAPAPADVIETLWLFAQPVHAGHR